MKEKHVIVIVVLVVAAATTYNLAQGRKAYRDCLAAQLVIAKTSDSYVPSCYR